jgi:hypothetical protein
MTQYTRRTCHYCGMRDIQPNMQQKTITVKSGSSKSGVGVSTLAGAFLGHKASSRAIGRTVFNSSKRNYTRDKQIWACSPGCGIAKVRQATQEYSRAKVAAKPPVPVKQSQVSTAVVESEAQETLVPKKSSFRKWLFGVPIVLCISLVPFLYTGDPVPAEISDALISIFTLWMMIITPWAICRKIKRDWFT